MEQLPVDGQSGVSDRNPTAQEGRAPNRLPIEPICPQIRSIQPGGGVCMQIELFWGRCRRAYLRAFRRRYLTRMRELKLAELDACPHEVLDPRDTKFFRNQGPDCWAPEDDPFAWRDRLPLARAGLAELLILGASCGILAGLLAVVYPPVAWIPALAGLFVLWFFRDPKRTSPSETGQVLAPADGRIASIDEIAHDEFIDGPAVVIGIFLSVFNVHLNRVPAPVRIIGLSYHPGKFLNALRPESARANERLTVRMEESAPPYRRLIVRQIAGAIARRIVCWVRPGDELPAGARFGMIKFGSRTELVLPRQPGFTVAVRRGQRVKAGVSVLARFPNGTHPS